MRKCKEPLCENKNHAKGLCDKHYQRIYYHKIREERMPKMRIASRIRYTQKRTELIKKSMDWVKKNNIKRYKKDKERREKDPTKKQIYNLNNKLYKLYNRHSKNIPLILKHEKELLKLKTN